MWIVSNNQKRSDSKLFRPWFLWMVDLKINRILVWLIIILEFDSPSPFLGILTDMILKCLARNMCRLKCSSKMRIFLRLLYTGSIILLEWQWIGFILVIYIFFNKCYSFVLSFEQIIFHGFHKKIKIKWSSKTVFNIDNNKCFLNKITMADNSTLP